MSGKLSLSAQRMRVAGSALLAPLAIGAIAWWVWQGDGNPALTAPDALLVALRWLLIPGFCLLVGIGTVGNQRFFSDAIDGRADQLPQRIEIMLRYNRNTLEQIVLAAIAWVGLAIALPAMAERLFPALAVLFGIGRAAFLAGYLYAPWGRAFGFGLTAYPTFIAYGWLITRLW